MLVYTSVIVGFDPGTVSGIAIIDFHGNVIYTGSFRGGLKEAVEIIKQFGKPAIIAGDKPGLEAVRQLAAYFGAIAWFPKEPLSFKEKKDIGKVYNTASDHEADALAAALAARKAYSKLIRKLTSLESQLFLMLMRREAANIKDALSKVFKSKKKGNFTRPKIDYREVAEMRKRRIEKLEKTIEAKDFEIEELKKRIAVLEKRVEELEKAKRPADVEALMDYLAFYKKKAGELEAKVMEMKDELERIKEEVKRFRRLKDEEEIKDEKEKILKAIEDYKKRFLNF